jgi:tetratricopeptide (TPR) repeat protein
MGSTQQLDEFFSGQWFHHRIRQLPEKWRHLAPYLRTYAGLLILAGLLFQLAYPITLSDSDMWYHLDGGRYFWQQGDVPDSSFFSFLSPDRTFVNYYWGFQALLAKTYEFGGYQALLILRAALFFLTTLFAYRYIIEEKTLDRSSILFILLFIAYFILIEGRIANLRPHLFSHLFILVFLYILERRPRWTPLLPLLTAAWANLHGIEYPVPVLIGGAYFLEFLHGRYVDGTADGQHGWPYAFWILACAPALLATPHGLELLGSPFSVAAHTSLYIAEMKPLNPKLLYSVFLSGSDLKVSSVFSVLFLFCSFALLRGLLDRSLRISHGIMALGAYLLLFKGNRFIWEWTLLVLPAVTHFVARMDTLKNGRQIVSVVHVLMAVVMVLPFADMVRRLPEHAGYPHDSRKEPTGIIRFLEQVNTGGKLMAPPSQSGFLHWKLHPDYTVHNDLQMSLFSDLDLYTVFSFYRSQNGLANTLGQYRPDYIAAEKKNGGFRKLIKEHPEYVPVFAGDMQILYANKELHPELADRHGLKLVDPFSLAEVNKGIELDSHIAELERMLAIFPESDRINHTITRLLFNAKRFYEALPWAKRFVHYHPENPNSHYLLGNIMENTGACDQAIAHYQTAKHYSDVKFKRVLDTQIGSCYYALEDFSAAYDYLWKGLNPYAKQPTDEDLYQLAFSAFVVGETEESILLLKMLLHNSPQEKKKVMLEAQALLDKLEQEGDQTPSFLQWLLQRPAAMFKP